MTTTEIDYTKPFHVVMRVAREAAGLSQGQAADLVYEGPGYAIQPWMSAVERGVRFPTEDQVKNFAELYGLNTNKLLECWQRAKDVRDKKHAVSRKRGGKKAAAAKKLQTALERAQQAQDVAKKYGIKWNTVTLPEQPLGDREQTQYSVAEEELLVAYLANAISLDRIAWALGRSAGGVGAYAADRLAGRKAWKFETQQASSAEKKALFEKPEVKTSKKKLTTQPATVGMAMLCPVCKGHGALENGRACFVPACGGRGVIT